jgi:hypothetical protein
MINRVLAKAGGQIRPPWIIPLKMKYAKMNNGSGRVKEL